nr:prolyl oligopeptidase family serine peptidase [Saccharofermentans sp.]
MIHRDTDMFRRAVTVALIFSLVLGLCSCTQSKPRPQSLITDVVETDDNTYECQFKDKRFRFMLYLPEKTDSNTPLILMLCGLGQNSPGFRKKTHMDETACPRGYAVCYVQPGKGTAGKGWDCGLYDPIGVDSLDYLVNLVIYLQDEYGLSQTKAFAAGFSNGGFMIHRIAMEAPDTFLAVASVAGMMTTKVWDE